jgi:hypothetical protein
MPAFSRFVIVQNETRSPPSVFFAAAAGCSYLISKKELVMMVPERAKTVFQLFPPARGLIFDGYFYVSSIFFRTGENIS